MKIKNLKNFPKKKKFNSQVKSIEQSKRDAKMYNKALKEVGEIDIIGSDIMNYREKMERYIGRKLKSNEVVHHIDSNTHNNSIDNLQVVTRKEHSNMHRTPEEIETNVGDMMGDNFKKEIYQIIRDKRFNSFKKALSSIFTPAQKEIIVRKIRGIELSKTEQEYYSRKIKDKLVAITNETLQEIIELIV